MTASDYDTFADAYSAENESSLFNAYYNRPEMLRLAGDVSGRRILDAGCGSGPLSAALRAKGAVVTGFDASAAMVDLARQRMGDDADLHVADLGAPLPFADNEFDDVVASLVLHYLEDWAGPLAELRRVLKPGGRLILSVIHPSVYAIVYPEADYFAHTKYSEEYTFQRTERGPDLLAPTTARHNRRLHRRRVPHRRRQRTTPCAGHSSRGAPARPGGGQVVPVLPLLRAGVSLRQNSYRSMGKWVHWHLRRATAHRSVTIEVMTADEAVRGGGRFGGIGRHIA